MESPSGASTPSATTQIISVLVLAVLLGLAFMMGRWSAGRGDGGERPKRKYTRRRTVEAPSDE